eukprot:c34197_g1_i1 orf=214-2067(-)
MSSSRIICAICYEDAKPTSEDLQSVSLCGHVFHELCLQQWLEYCPRGKKPTCPLCKQQFSGKDVHRLFFQAATELTQARSASKPSSESESQALEELQMTVQKLEGQLSATKAALISHQQQLKDLNGELSLYTCRAEKAEVAQAEANREKANCKESLLRTQEELKRSMAERCKLLEKNTTLSKDIATYKLVQDLDLNEDDAVRLVSIGRGTNKDEIINTLSRSLVVRNRTYKDLMAKCNELGMGESRALRKSEKSLEQMKRLKARVQELEKHLEERESVTLRSLKQCTHSCNKETSQDNKVIAPNNGHGLIDVDNPFGQPSILMTSKLRVPSLSMNGQYQLMHSRLLNAESSPSQKMKIFQANNVGGAVEREELHDAEDSFLEDCADVNIASSNHSLNCNTLSDTCMEDFTEDRQYLQDSTNIPTKSGDRQAQLVGIGEDGSPDDLPTLSKESQISNLVIPDENFLVNAMEKNFLPVSVKKAGPCQGFLARSMPPNYELGGGISGHIAGTFRAENEGYITTSVGKWCRQATCGSENSILPSGRKGGPSNGSFILCGADGRGGQVKVLRPPKVALELEVNASQNWQRQAKRCKVTQSVRQGGSQQGALQIEHFFGRAAS